jgi:hypothetical protein
MKKPYYKLIEGFPRYRVGCDGSVWSKVTGKWTRLSPSLDTNGYPHVTLCGSNGNRKCSVHRLVLEAFAGECPAGMQCAHKDGRKTNNHHDNLSWKTPVGNAEDKRRHGTHLECDNATSAKLSNTGASVVVQLLRDGKLSLKQIATECGVSKGCVQAIASGRSWLGLTGGKIHRTSGRTSGPAKQPTVLSDAQVSAMRTEAFAGETYDALASKYQVSSVTALLICTGKRRQLAGGPICGGRTAGRRPKNRLTR